MNNNIKYSFISHSSIIIYKEDTGIRSSYLIYNGKCDKRSLYRGFSTLLYYSYGTNGRRIRAAKTFVYFLVLRDRDIFG